MLLLPAVLVSAVGRKPLGAVYIWKGWVLQPAPLLLAEALAAVHGSGAGVCLKVWVAGTISVDDDGPLLCHGRFALAGVCGWVVC